jgi:hypothetical protein
MAKSIRNYTSRQPVNLSIAKIQELLVANGAQAVLMNYEQGTGRIESLSFQISLEEKMLSFKLPVNWKKFQEVLQKDRVYRCDDIDHIMRVAWKNMYDWVDIQMTMYRLKQAELVEIFLPYVIVNNQGDTLYKKFQENPKLLLGSGN